MESIDELRSKLSFLKTDFYYLSSWIGAICKKYIEKSYSLPIPNPTHFTRQIKNEIEKVQEKFQDLCNAFRNQEIIKSLLLAYNVERILNSLNSDISFLQQFINQRISTSSVPIEFVHYFKGNLFEISTFNKVYTCADCVLTDFFVKIMGTEWVRNKKCFPVTFFGEDYQIGRVNYITQIPLADSYRCRFWPILAHEVSHIKIFELIDSENAIFLDLLYDMRDELKRWPVSISSIVVTKQIIELLCDLIATYISGPAYLNASAERLRPEIPIKLHDDTLIFGKHDALVNAIQRYYTHPPNDLRIHAMLRMVVDYLKIEDGWVQSLGDYVKLKNSELSENNRSGTFLYFYESCVDSFFDEIYSFLNSIIPESFTLNSSKWKQIKANYYNKNFENSDPTELLNIIWLDRNRSFHSLKRQMLNNVLKRRRIETKLFNTIMKYLYDYYSKKISKYTFRRAITYASWICYDKRSS